MPALAPNTWIIVPAYNEAPVLDKTLQDLLPLGATTVVVDDGSTDDTWDIVLKYPVHALRHEVNLGQGAALQTGIAYALSGGAALVVTFDADGQMSATDLPALCAPVAAGEADVCLGNRFAGAESHIPRQRRWLLRAAALFSNALTGLSLQDATNGLRAMNRRAASHLRISKNGMAHGQEILGQFAGEHLRLLEVPVTITYSPYSLRKGQSGFNAFNILWDLLFHP